MNTSWYQDALSSSLETSKWEHIPVVIFEQPKIAAARVAQEIAQLVREREADGLKVVLGLATGSTPIFVYQELARHASRGGAQLPQRHHVQSRRILSRSRRSTRRATTASCASICSIIVDIARSADSHPRRLDSRARTWRRPASGTRSKSSRRAGSICRLLGIGRTGHIGFNEPGSSRRSGTRFIHLDRLTRLDAIKDFQSEEPVPRTAITMGVRTILQARRIVIMAFGEHKAAIVARAVEGEVSAEVPATYLQDHENCLMVLDEAAASQLTRIQTPWLVGPLEEMGLAGPTRCCGARVTWLARKTGKAILKLTDEDYNSHSPAGAAFAARQRLRDQPARLPRSCRTPSPAGPGGKPPGRTTRRSRSRGRCAVPRRRFIRSAS